MRGALIAAGAMLAASPMLAEPWGLMATPVECAALESLVVFGLVDGDPGGDTTEFTAVVQSGDAQRCVAWLDSYGLGEGMRLDTCRAAFDLLNRNGAAVGTEPDVIREVLSPQYESACDDILADQAAGQ